jgi:hypothetical protein
VSDSHEIRHRSVYKHSLGKRDFREEQLSDSHTLLKGVNELLTAFSILIDQFR